jgi:Fe-S-cluster containining protein
MQDLPVIPDPDDIPETDEILDPSVSCDGCGACCTHIGTPPGYGWFFAVHEDGTIAPAPWLKGTDDERYFAGLPDEVKRELADYYAAVRARLTPDRTADDDMPCLWFDEQSRRCRHWEHRPQVCRDFAVGSGYCLIHREECGIEK